VSGRDIVSTAMRIAREHVNNAASLTERKPSDARVKAGNYRKGKITWHGLRISIENAKGSIRRGVDAKGKPWSVTMPASYGYVLRSVGADDDHIDLYMGPNPLSQTVWVIDQVDARNGKFDEHKVMAGFSGKDEAIETYKKAFSDNRGHERIGAVTRMDIGQFRRWLARGDTTAPLGM
jgi:hypothetical protein